MNCRPAQEVLDRLERVRPTSTGWSAACPGHLHDNGDRNSSLSVRVCEDGRVLLHCFAGCATRDILRELNLEWIDLFPAESRDGRSIRPKRMDLSDLLVNARPNWSASLDSLRKLLIGIEACAKDGAYLPNPPRPGSIRARIIA